MSASLLATVGHGSSALWYTTRATGLVALVLLTGTLVLGIVCSIGWVSERWPRFLSQSLHRNLSLIGLSLIVVHVFTTVIDGYVPIGLADAVIPFRSPYRPLWVGLGACAFDVLLAVAITSGLRRRIGIRAWRMVHWLAYACWRIALFHGLGSGSDTRLRGVQFLYLLCVVAVVAALGWRLLSGLPATKTWRLVGAVGASSVVFTAALFAMLGPLRPGWSRRSGTSSTVLAQLSSSTPTIASGSTPSAPSRTSGAPSGTFQSAVGGTYSVTGPDARGREQVVLSMRVLTDNVPLVVTLEGQAADGGVEMTSSTVTLGSQSGVVTSLDGSSIGATVGSPQAPEHLSIQITLDRVSHVLTGTVSGSDATAGGGSGT
jgi:methionine sulfoxide reductase heme-binding subunit